jgi:hypothetical protein
MTLLLARNRASRRLTDDVADRVAAARDARARADAGQVVAFLRVSSRTKRSTPHPSARIHPDS